MSSSTNAALGARRGFQPSTAAVVALAALFAGWSEARSAVLEDTVATVNGQPVLLSEYQKEFDAALENFRRIAPSLLAEKDGPQQLRRKVLDQMIDNELMTQEGEKKKVKIHDREVDRGIAEVKERSFRRDEAGRLLSDEEMDAALDAELRKGGISPNQFRDRIRKQILIRKVVEEDIRPLAKPPEEADLRAAFEKLQYVVKGDTRAVAGMPEEEGQAYLALGSRMKDLASERVRVAHILVKLDPKPALVEKTKALQRIQDIRKRIDMGEDFGELARKNSDDTESSARNGDLGFIVHGWLPPEFEKVAFATQVGAVSDPVETQFGYHLIRVLEKKAAEKITYDKVKDDVSQFVYNLKFQAELEKYAKALRAKAHIEIHLPKDMPAPKPESKEPPGDNNPIKKP
ncbi:MAG: peptidylprolyl isomerase [Elusimicrobia bacterium]|nr:peptidylprolyl isomerase [Elusimicrobiota bacterium]